MSELGCSSKQNVIWYTKSRANTDFFVSYFWHRSWDAIASRHIVVWGICNEAISWQYQLFWCRGSCIRLLLSNLHILSVPRFFWEIFLFQNEHLGLIFVEDQIEFLEYLLSCCNERVEMLLFEDKNNVVCIGFLVDIGNIREFWN